MTRINVGISPQYLADQHLIAESAEIMMIPGQLVYTNWKIKGKIPNKFTLGAGHMNFFKDKLNYLVTRLEHINNEMRKRGFNPGADITKYMQIASTELCNDWNPSIEDTMIVRQRMVERLNVRSNGSSALGYYRYNRIPIDDITTFSDNIIKSELYTV